MNVSTLAWSGPWFLLLAACVLARWTAAYGHETGVYAQRRIVRGTTAHASAVRKLYADPTAGRIPTLADRYNGGPFDRNWPDTIAVCVLIQNEDDLDLQEFIQYHRYIGVDKFYIRENGESSASVPMLQPYVDKGIVDFGLLPGPKHPTQTNWFNRCAAIASRRHAWVAFIDLDEFIVVLKEQKAVTSRDALKHLLASSGMRYASSLSLQWVLFGSAGNMDRPAEGQLKGYNRCTGALSKQMKCVASTFWLNPYAAFQPMHVHQCFFRAGAASVLGNLDPLPMWNARWHKNSSVVGSTHVAHLSAPMHNQYKAVTDEYQAVLFHYVTRYAKFFLERKIRRRSGAYASDFGKAQANQTLTEEEELRSFAEFESSNGFDGDQPICHEGERLADALVAARTAGWTGMEACPTCLPAALSQ